MKVQEVILKAMAGKLKWWEAAEIIGVSDRTMRRWRARYEEHGYDGLYDYRKKQPSPKRIAVSTLETVLQLYREKYFDFNVRRHRDQLHVGEAGAPGRWAGEEAEPAWDAPAATAAAVAARDATAHRCQQARLVRGWAAQRSDHDFGRCHQRDLLRAISGRRRDADVDAGSPGSSGEARHLLCLVQRPCEPFLRHPESGREGGSEPRDATGAGAGRVGN